MKIYVITYDLDIGYIDHLCTCDECKKRNNIEVTINYLDGSFMLQATIKDLLNESYVLALSDDIDELRNIKSVLQKSNSYLCKLLENELLNRQIES